MPDQAVDRCAVNFEKTTELRLLDGLERLRKAALVTVPGVAMQDAFRDDAVDDALRLAELLLRRGLVAGGYRLLRVLDRAAHRGAQAHVVHAALLRLSGALARRFDVRHGLD